MMFGPAAPTRHLWEQGGPIEDWCAAQVAELPVRIGNRWTEGCPDFMEQVRAVREQYQLDSINPS